MLKKICLTLVLAVFGIVSTAFAAPNVKDGEWEMTSRVEMPGMPFAPPPTKFTQCITSKDMVPQKQDEGCKITKQNISGNTASWAMTCKTDDGELQMDGNVTYKGDVMEGVTNIRPKDGPAMTSKISGKRIGECKTQAASPSKPKNETASKLLAKIPQHPVTYEKAKTLCQEKELQENKLIYRQIKDEIEGEDNKAGDDLSRRLEARKGDTNTGLDAGLDAVMSDLRQEDANVNGEAQGAAFAMMKDRERNFDEYEAFLGEQRKEFKRESKPLDEKIERLNAMAYGDPRCEGGGGEGGSQAKECERMRKEAKMEAKRDNIEPKYLQLVNKYLSKINPKWNEYKGKVKQSVDSAEEKAQKIKSITGAGSLEQQALQNVSSFLVFSEEACKFEEFFFHVKSQDLFQ